MRNFIQSGKSITILALAAVTSGDGVLAGAMFGVAATSAKIGDLVTIEREGVYQLPKLEAQAWVQGAKVYWNDTAKQCTTVVGSNTHIGYAAAAASDPSTVGVVVLL